jgi:hypothetical protein
VRLWNSRIVSMFLVAKETIMAEKTMNRTVSAERESAIKYLVDNVGLSPLQAEVLVSLRGTDLETLTRITSTFRAEAPA